MGVWVVGLPPLSLMGSTWMPSLGPWMASLCGEGVLFRILGSPSNLSCCAGEFLAPASEEGGC